MSRSDTTIDRAPVRSWMARRAKWLAVALTVGALATGCSDGGEDVPTGGTDASTVSSSTSAPTSSTSSGSSSSSTSTTAGGGYGY